MHLRLIGSHPVVLQHSTDLISFICLIHSLHEVDNPSCNANLYTQILWRRVILWTALKCFLVSPACPLNLHLSVQWLKNYRPIKAIQRHSSLSSTVKNYLSRPYHPSRWQERVATIHGNYHHNLMYDHSNDAPDGIFFHFFHVILHLLFIII